MPLSTSLNDLPVELLDKIVELVHRPELLALCATSRRLNPVAMRWLYYAIMIRTAEQALSCCTTIIKQPVAAQALRRWSIDLRGQDLFGPFWTLLARAIWSVTGLVVLDLSFAPAVFELGLLDSCILPQLRQCRLPYNSSIAPFLNNHVTLENLIIHPPAALTSNRSFIPAPLPLIEMPNMAGFIGPATMAASLVPNSVVKSLTIFWEASAAESANDIARCFSQAFPTLKSMENFIVDWDSRILEAIMVHCTPLEKLGFHNANPSVTWRSIEEFLELVEGSLPTFHSLHSLSITFLDNSFHYDFEDVEIEYQTVARWGAMLPNLRSCVLPSGTVWTRMPFNTWLPDRGGDPHLASLKAEWFIETLSGLRFPREMYTGVLNTTERLMEFRNIMAENSSIQKVWNYLEVAMARAVQQAGTRREVEV
ncbi:hypothetical protein BDN72DRAFT_878667 [Pluteus cervinus]|uniref:Uncharacterized protein n=1 Tax=Pluteus cervinus TaxID=181527 RepID=A0ACD3ATT8_9AGAR|nr:hypothetical protein BDN72DRAFT_878667 [Pluteus cervinus]